MLNSIAARLGIDRKARGPVSYYPKVAFHGIRIAQLISSLIVFSIMATFVHYLRQDNYPIPWTFIWALAATLGTFAAQAFTIVLHCCTGLHPHLNVVINSGLLVLWALSWGLLTFYMTPVLRGYCNVENWNEDTGIQICRTYKALFTFQLTGLLSAIAAVCLDVFVLRHQSRRGVYRLQDIDHKNLTSNTAYEPSQGQFKDGPFDANSYGEGGIAKEPRLSEAWEASPRPSFGPYGERSEGASSLTDKDGYAQPDEQFEYDSTYHGGRRASPSPSRA